MIIVKMQGGLGNQMFQYAAARAIAYRRGTVLKLDCESYAQLSSRRYELHRFKIHGQLLNRLERFVVCPPPRRGAVAAAKILRRMVPELRVTCVQERGVGFDSTVATKIGSLYLQGYWQSEKYFSDLAPLIRREFTLGTTPDLENARLIDKMNMCSSVCVHVRRGDYLANPAVKAMYGFNNLDYYRDAVAIIAARVPDPVFFVFSDDHEWAKQHLRIGFPIRYVTHNAGRQDHEDLRLMSHGKHFIIANSTFSWWGAWLAENADKVVIAPARWFGDPEISTADLVPPSWIRV